MRFHGDKRVRLQMQLPPCPCALPDKTVENKGLVSRQGNSLCWRADDYSHGKLPFLGRAFSASSAWAGADDLHESHGSSSLREQLKALLLAIR